MPFARRVSKTLLLPLPLLLAGCFYDTSGAPADIDTETDSDTGAGDAGADSGVGGLGEPCTETGGECAGLEADFCLYSPIEPTEGACTVSGCLADGCPATYTCCDCTGASYFFTDLCAPSEYAEQLPLAGCTCA
ncbi:MAG: hypothetical protein M0R80_19565 [Proteobacteria bacterium]|jgi:hypothetical protein|nr:hypothetical protein [Pseudomonadota bacterium]